MFALLFPFVIAAVPAPVPTLPPQIGTIFVRGHCSDAQSTLKRALPLLIKNDDAISGAINGLAKVDTHQDAATRLTITRTRTASNVIFKNLEKAKDEAMKLHVLAAASVNPVESAQFTAVADSLDSIVQQQNDVADEFNGYADTADMSLLWQGSEDERKMRGATGPGDNQTAQLMMARTARHPSLAYTDIPALTTNVFKDAQGMHRQLRDTYNTTTLQVQQLVRTCAPVRRRQ